MTASVRIASDPSSADLVSVHGMERSVRVGTAATMLDAAEQQIRRLLKDGDLQGHRFGKRGVRISVASIEAYRRRGQLGGKAPSEPVKPPPTRASAAHREALAGLRELGILEEDRPGRPAGRQKREKCQ